MTKDQKISTVVGVMSGTSLDGLDIALCEFKQTNDGYEYRIIDAETYPYSEAQRSKLSNSPQFSALNHVKLHQRFGKHIGKSINIFLSKNKLKADAIASHGHTVFHQPQQGFSTQIGCGATIAGITGLTTVCDMRSLDVALNGQGAPLVPIGDKLLFGKYKACLNLGGIANISFDNTNNDRIAFDICICNMVLNHLANLKGLAFDDNGYLASIGKVDTFLLETLNSLQYYKVSGSKSLGYEWFEDNFLNLIKTNNNNNIEDLLATFSEHAAFQITEVINKNKINSVLVTGGGAFNKELIALMKQKTSAEIIIPDNKIVNFKEALVFGFLGYLRLNEKTNTLCSVTGAKQDSIGGAVYFMAPEN